MGYRAVSHPSDRSRRSSCGGDFGLRSGVRTNASRDSTSWPVPNVCRRKGCGSARFCSTVTTGSIFRAFVSASLFTWWFAPRSMTWWDGFRPYAVGPSLGNSTRCFVSLCEPQRSGCLNVFSGDERCRPNPRVYFNSAYWRQRSSAK